MSWAQRAPPPVPWRAAMEHGNELPVSNMPGLSQASGHGTIGTIGTYHGG